MVYIIKSSCASIRRFSNTGAISLFYKLTSKMTSSNGNIFRVTGPLWVESIGHRWISIKRRVTRSFDVFCDLCLNNRMSKQSRNRLLQSLLRSFWCHCNKTIMMRNIISKYIRHDKAAVWYVIRENSNGGSRFFVLMDISESRVKISNCIL